MDLETLRNRKRQIIDTMPKPEGLPDGTVFGYYSCVLPDKTRLIPYHYLRTFANIYDTETAFTRVFLQSLPKRIIRRAELDSYLQSRPPLFVRPTILKDAVYIDLVKAYPSIYKIIGWECDYIRGRYFGQGDKLEYPFPSEWKAGRSFVISGARHLQFGRYIASGQVKTRPYLSPYSNPPLVAAVYDTLAMIGRFAEYALHACYWNVDGGIMPVQAAEIFKAFVASLGLEARVKFEGGAEVLSSGYWRVGSHHTKKYDAQVGGVSGGDWLGMDKEQADWFYNRFRVAGECASEHRQEHSKAAAEQCQENPSI